MKLDVKNVTAWVTLGVYSIVLLSLLQPGGTGQAAVKSFGDSLAGIAAVAS